MSGRVRSISGREKSCRAWSENLGDRDDRVNLIGRWVPTIK